MLVPGPAHQKKVTQLEEQLSQERLARQHVERELGSATLAFERLKNRIIREMGKAGEEYVKEAISESDANVWESSVSEDDTERDKHE